MRKVIHLKFSWKWIPLAAALLLLCSCMPLEQEALITQNESVPVQIISTELVPAQSCSGTFIEHLLDHTTTTSNETIALYESNGSGVGINDLDNDGDLDIVLANLRDPNTILWNEGALNFRTQRLAHGDSRAVSLVDVDGNGWLDIVFTQRFKKPIYWQNQGRGQDEERDVTFTEGILPDVNNPFFAMDWADLDNDGDLELVAASYDTELRKYQGPIFSYRGDGVGVFVYEQQEDAFIAHRLAEQADALAIALSDLDGDGQLDILVGNDFDRPDYSWLQSEEGWVKAMPFPSTTQNTMSFDIGDIDNDGTLEIFATDMKPYSQDEQMLAAWQPLMGMMTHPTAEGDPQILENVLLAKNEEQYFQNQGVARGVDATGWSWSSKFGDLDNDGFLDIYVVNGMIADGLLAHLPNNELVEENQALRNDGQGNFIPAPEWGLASTASGRGMSMADLDNDGDLDIVVNNLQSPAQLFENQHCDHSSLQVDLRWPSSKNSHAIGANLVLHTDIDSYHRQVRANSGYLSGTPTRVHFGIPKGAMLEQLEIYWPDGELSIIPKVEVGTAVMIER